MSGPHRSCQHHKRAPRTTSVRITRHARHALARMGPSTRTLCATTGRTKSDLLVIEFPTEAKVEEVRQTMLGMQRECIIEAMK